MGQSQRNTTSKPNGNLPLMCRITVDGEIKQFSCKMDVPPRLWDVKNSRASGKSVGPLFGSNKVKTLERENTALHKEIADHEETIEALQDGIQTMQADHSREIREM